MQKVFHSGLNNILDLNLENLNATQRKNFPAIDLTDFKNRVRFKLRLLPHLNIFDTLYFYIITERNGKYSKEKVADKIPDGLQFDR